MPITGCYHLPVAISVYFARVLDQVLTLPHRHVKMCDASHRELVSVCGDFFIRFETEIDCAIDKIGVQHDKYNCAYLARLVCNNYEVIYGQGT